MLFTPSNPTLNAIKVSIRRNILAAAHEERPFEVFRISFEKVHPLEKTGDCLRFARIELTLRDCVSRNVRCRINYSGAGLRAASAGDGVVSYEKEARDRVPG